MALMMSDLPRDLLEEIICRIPSTSLKQLRSTCKQWNRFFNDERFTRKQLEKAPKEFLVLMRHNYKVCLMSPNFSGISAELRPMNPLHRFDIAHVCQHDGLLLCTRNYTTWESRVIMVWNPCNGQTRRIQPSARAEAGTIYTLGSCYHGANDNKRYKILSLNRLPRHKTKDFQIFNLNSNSWRVLDVMGHDDYVSSLYLRIDVSFREKTYWLASDQEEGISLFLVSFDYSTERFERLPLPYQHREEATVSLSAVREEKLAFLYHSHSTLRAEVWVTNKIDDDETKAVSWSKFLTFDFKPPLGVVHVDRFLVDEDKIVIVWYGYSNMMLYIVGEDSTVTPVYIGTASNYPNLFYYVPSLTQIPRGEANDSATSLF